MIEKQFYRVDGTAVQLHDTEDKSWWLTYGDDNEKAFLSFCSTNNILPGLSLNPERSGGKRRGAPEFIFNGKYLDLKVQHQPFFEAEKLYKIPPRYAITLNWRDVKDVREKYPDCQVAYWVNWTSVRYIKLNRTETKPTVTVADISINPLHGVWYMTPQLMFGLEEDAIKKGNLHWYMRRFADTRGNAKSSYVIDIRDLQLVWLDPSCSKIEKRPD